MTTMMKYFKALYNYFYTLQVESDPAITYKITNEGVIHVDTESLMTSPTFKQQLKQVEHLRQLLEKNNA